MRLMGGTSGTASTGSPPVNPQGIVQTHSQLARPADGLVVEKAEAKVC